LQILLLMLFKVYSSLNIIEFLVVGGDGESHHDVQLDFYLLKLGDILSYTVDPPKILDNDQTREINLFPVVTLFKLSETLKSICTSPGLWKLCFKNSEYFVKNNARLILEAKKNASHHSHLHRLGASEVIKEKGFDTTISSIFDVKAVLRNYGIKAFTLFSIARFIIYLNLGRIALIDITKELAHHFQIDKLAYSHIVDLIEDFAILHGLLPRDRTNHLRNEATLQISVEVIYEEIFPRLMAFLTPRESLELCLTSKKQFSTLMSHFIKSVLAIFEIDDDLRKKLWLKLAEDVKYIYDVDSMGPT